MVTVRLRLPLRLEIVCLYALLIQLDGPATHGWPSFEMANGRKDVAGHTVEEELDSTLESVDQAEEIVLSEARKMGFDEDEQHRIGIAVRECMVNAVVHGNCYNARKKVRLAVSSTPDQLDILIADQGEGFSLEKLPDPLAEENILRQSGRGVLMIQAFMDRFQVRPLEPFGTEVRMTKYLVKQDRHDAGS